MADFNLNPATLERDLSKAADTAMTVITTYGLKVIGAIVILVVGWILAGMAQRWILRAGSKAKRLDMTVTTFAASTFKYVVMTFTLIAVLSSFGVETTSFVAVLGAVGIAIGLALQGTLGHVASGLMLILFRPFRVGDYIEAGGVAGTVHSISLFVTEIDTADNVHVVVPNGLIWGGTMRNLHENRTRRLEIQVVISYDHDVSDAIDLVRGLIKNDNRILKTPAPVVGAMTLTESGVRLVIQVWMEREQLADVQYRLNQAIKEAFDAKGIAFAAPQRVVQVMPGQQDYQQGLAQQPAQPTSPPTPLPKPPG